MSAEDEKRVPAVMLEGPGARLVEAVRRAGRVLCRLRRAGWIWVGISLSLGVICASASSQVLHHAGHTAPGPDSYHGLYGPRWAIITYDSEGLLYLLAVGMLALHLTIYVAMFHLARAWALRLASQLPLWEVAVGLAPFRGNPVPESRGLARFVLQRTGARGDDPREPAAALPGMDQRAGSEGDIDALRRSVVAAGWRTYWTRIWVIGGCGVLLLVWSLNLAASGHASWSSMPGWVRDFAIFIEASLFNELESRSPPIQLPYNAFGGAALGALLTAIAGFAVAISSRGLSRRWLRWKLRTVPAEQLAAALLPLRGEEGETQRLVEPLIRDLRVATEVTPAPPPLLTGSELAPSRETPLGATQAILGRRSRQRR